MKQETIEMMRAVAKGPTNNVSFGTFAEEEASELIKEICKIRRNKGDTNQVISEAIDVIAASAILLFSLDVSWETIEQGVMYKAHRAIRRYEEMGEL